MASAGQYGVNIGKGAASGALLGSALGPWGAGIGGVVGGAAGGLSTLLSSSDEAKEREKQKRLYLQQMKERADQDQQRRLGAIMGFNGTPMDIALGTEAYDPQKASADFDAHMPNEPTPDYGGLVMSLGQLGGGIGQMSRTSALQEKLDALQQAAKNGRYAEFGQPWGGYSSGGGSYY